jgi:squalene-hopene/tetraprenyl-beta-curcumene cyclase
MLRRGVQWIISAQNSDGGWGGAAGCASTTEETALAIESLARATCGCLAADEPVIRPALDRGLSWLVRRVETGDWQQPAPIGFYFAKLWYYERLYPLIFTAGALREALRCNWLR